MLAAEPAADVHRELHAIEARLAETTAQHHADLARLEGQRDRLLQRLLDNEGAHDRRFVPVR